MSRILILFLLLKMKFKFKNPKTGEEKIVDVHDLIVAESYKDIAFEKLICGCDGTDCSCVDYYNISKESPVIHVGDEFCNIFLT